MTRFCHVDDQKAAGFPVTAACEAVGMSTSGYYDWANQLLRAKCGRTSHPSVGAGHHSAQLRCCALAGRATTRQSADVPEQRSSSAGVCPQCGRPLNAHNRHVRFQLPEPVLASHGQERTDGTWMSHDSAAVSVMMQVPGIGPFVRCMLPVKLSGGFTVTFGVWLAVHPNDLQKAFSTWWEPSYAALTLDGLLANRLPLWDCFASPAHAAVNDPDQTPHVTSSPDALLAQVLREEWPHEKVLAALPD